MSQDPVDVAADLTAADRAAGAELTRTAELAAVALPTAAVDIDPELAEANLAVEAMTSARLLLDSVVPALRPCVQLELLDLILDLALDRIAELKLPEVRQQARSGRPSFWGRRRPRPDVRPPAVDYDP